MSEHESVVNRMLMNSPKRQSKQVKRYCKARLELLCNHFTIVPSVLHQMIVDYASPIEYIVLISNDKGLLVRMQAISLLSTNDNWISQIFRLPQTTLCTNIKKIHSLSNLSLNLKTTELHNKQPKGEGFILEGNCIIKNPWHIFNNNKTTNVWHDNVMVVCQLNYKLWIHDFLGHVGNEDKEAFLYYRHTEDSILNLYRDDMKHGSGLSTVYAKSFITSQHGRPHIVQYNNVNYIFNLSDIAVVIYNVSTNLIDFIKIYKYRSSGSIVGYLATIHGILCVGYNLNSFSMIDPVTKTNRILPSDPWVVVPFEKTNKRIMFLKSCSLYNNTIIVLFLLIIDTNNNRYYHIIWMDMLDAPGIWRNGGLPDASYQDAFIANVSYHDAFLTTLHDVSLYN
jgi:hypothetical protein